MISHVDMKAQVPDRDRTNPRAELFCNSKVTLCVLLFSWEKQVRYHLILEPRLVEMAKGHLKQIVGIIQFYMLGIAMI